MIDRHTTASLYSRYAIGLGRDDLKWEIPVYIWYVDGFLYGMALDVVKQDTDTPDDDASEDVRLFYGSPSQRRRFGTIY